MSSWDVLYAKSLSMPGMCFYRPRVCWSASHYCETESPNVVVFSLIQNSRLRQNKRRLRQMVDSIEAIVRASISVLVTVHTIRLQLRTTINLNRGCHANGQQREHK